MKKTSAQIKLIQIIEKKIAELEERQKAVNSLEIEKVISNYYIALCNLQS